MVVVSAIVALFLSVVLLSRGVCVKASSSSLVVPLLRALYGKEEPKPNLTWR